MNDIKQALIKSTKAVNDIDVTRDGLIEVRRTIIYKAHMRGMKSAEISKITGLTLTTIGRDLSAVRKTKGVNNE